jgi:hypothetical protein
MIISGTDTLIFSHVFWSTPVRYMLGNQIQNISSRAKP